MENEEPRTYFIKEVQIKEEKTRLYIELTEQQIKHILKDPLNQLVLNPKDLSKKTIYIFKEGAE